MTIKQTHQLRTRSGPKLLRRTINLRGAEIGEDGSLTVTASTDGAVDMGGYRESLSHQEGAVDYSAARSLLLNHNGNFLAGGIKRIWHEGNTLRAEIIIDPDAKFESGVNVLNAVRKGYVVGISIGYYYDIADASHDREQRLVTVSKWELREITITPTQADVAANTGRSLDDFTHPPRRGTNKDTHMELEDLLRMYPAKYRALIKKTWEKNQDASDSERVDAVVRAVNSAIERDAKPAARRGKAKRSETGTSDDDDDDTRSIDDDDIEPGDERSKAKLIRQGRRLNIERTLGAIASSHGLHDVDLTNERQFPNVEAGTRELVRLKAERDADGHTQPAVGGTGVQVRKDSQDKFRTAFNDAVANMASMGSDEHRGNDLRRCSSAELVRQFLQSRGVNTGNLRDDEISNFAARMDLGNLNIRDANQLAADFGNVLGDSFNKLVIEGYNNFVQTARLWCRQRQVRDFKQVDMAAIVSGLLADQDTDGSAFREIQLGEKSANGKLKLRGRTLRLTYQDWRNDDLGEFARLVAQLGEIASFSEDREAYKALLAATWGGRTTATAAFWNASTETVNYDGLSKAIADLESREITVGDESVPMNPMAGTILVPPRRYAAAIAATGQAAGAEITNANAGSDIQVVKSQWLANSGLAGSSADDYFVVGRNGDSVVQLRDQMFPEPVVRQVDPGFSPDLGFVVMHAYDAVMANQDNIQKGDWEQSQLI